MNFKKTTSRILSVFLLVVLFSTSAFAKGNAVISLGNDLSETESKEILNLFGAKDGDQIIKVTNAEERKYIGPYVDIDRYIGTKAISSSYVVPTRRGSGITVETYNIFWVTEDMLVSALATAGVKDAHVKVAAPKKASGSAALTGIIKGFENATGQYISEEEKQVASEEIATAGDLGQSIGQNEAAQIINTVKEEVVKNDLTDPDEIKVVVEDAAQQINVSLTEEQKAKIAELMEKVSNLDLNVEDIKGQLKNMSDKLKDLSENSEEVKGILNKIVAFFKDFFTRAGNFFKEITQ